MLIGIKITHGKLQQLAPPSTKKRLKKILINIINLGRFLFYQKKNKYKN